jgi:hypothetical protein
LLTIILPQHSIICLCWNRQHSKIIHCGVFRAPITLYSQTLLNLEIVREVVSLHEPVPRSEPAALGDGVVPNQARVFLRGVGELSGWK